MSRCRVLVGVLALLVASTTAPPGVAAAEGWSPPVDGPVVRPFAPSQGRFGPGHRGVDYAVAPGTAVRAAGAGLVVFAGRVAGGLHVVVAHSGGGRTGYSYLSDLGVHRGDTVARGALVGFSGGTGPAHVAGVVHFSLRDSSGYADPLRLFGATSAGAPIVHLAPLDPPGPRTCRPAPGQERRPGSAATLTVDPANGRESSRPQSHR